MSLTQVNGMDHRHPSVALAWGLTNSRVNRHCDLDQTCTTRHLSAADVEGGSATASAPVSMKELLSNKGVFIGCMIFLLQQFSGVNSVVYFSSSVFAKVQSSPVFPSTPTPLLETLSARQGSICNVGLHGTRWTHMGQLHGFMCSLQGAHRLTGAAGARACADEGQRYPVCRRASPMQRWPAWACRS